LDIYGLCKTPIFITASAINLLACFVFIIVGCKITRASSRPFINESLLTESTRQAALNAIKKAIFEMWLIIGTIIFVVTVQTILNTFYITFATKQTCLFPDVSNTVYGWVIEFGCRSVNYCFWVFVVVYIFWPSDFRD